MPSACHVQKVIPFYAYDHQNLLAVDPAARCPLPWGINHICPVCILCNHWFSHRHLSSYWLISIHVAVFLCSQFFLMFHVTVTTDDTPVTVVCTGASTTAKTVAIAPTPMELAAALGQNDVVLQPPLILVDTASGVLSWPLYHSNSLSNTCHLRLMPIMPWFLLWVSFSKFSLQAISSMLVYVTAFALYLQCHLH